MSCCTKRRWRSRRKFCEQGATTTININIGYSDDKFATTKLNHNDNEKKIVLALDISNSAANGCNVINTNGTQRILSKL